MPKIFFNKLHFQPYFIPCTYYTLTMTKLMGLIIP